MPFNAPKNTYPLSGSQMNIWRLEQSLSGTPVNNICETMLIRGRFDAGLVNHALNLVLQLFGTLRTRICLRPEDAQPEQYEAEYKPEQFPVFDFSLSGMGGFSHWEASVTREIMPLFDCPLYYFAIIRLGEHEGGVFIKTHHLISDGWSQVLLTNRIARIYLDLCEGRQESYEPSPDYRLHVQAEQEYLHSKAFERDRSFWQNELSRDFSPAVIREFSGAAVSPVGRRRTFAFSEVLNHAVYSFCVKNRVAPFSVFYMALAIYLHRMGQSRRFCLGVPIYNRSGVSDRESGGMFVSTLPLFGELDENWTFEQFNEHFTEQWYDLLRHQRFPFSEITAMSGRSGRLFDMVLSFQSSRVYTGREASVHFSGQWNYSGYQAEHLCIHLSCMESEKRCCVSYDYLTQLFSESEIERLHGYLVHILTQALEHPDRPVWQISMLSLEEREKVLYTFNQTDCRALPAGTLYERLQAQALEHPGRAAVIAGGQRHTYRELLLGANCIAHAAHGVCAEGGGVIAVVLEKGVQLVQAMTGIAQAGHAWVLIAPDTPAARIRDILSDSGACAVITAPETARRLGLDSLLQVIDPAAAKAQFDGAPPLPCPAQGSSLAYIVYTSGSTGKPKGVEIEQRSLLNFAVSMQDVYGRGAVLSLCSIGFDAFVLESMAALLCGRTLLFPVGAEGEDPRRLAGLITGYAAGFLACTPSRLQALLRDPEFSRAMRRVETVLCGGEPFPGELVRRLRQCTDARIYNQYGPSETTIGVSLSLLNDARTVTAGRPMPGCRLYVLDSRRSPLPVGACGELYIGGVCVGRGYRNLPELTAERFFDSPFEPDERLYRTGDLACLNEAGELVLRGRADSQVKLRGLRVELSEVSSRMAQHPGISAAAARLVPAGQSQSLVLYYVSPQELPHPELLSFAATYLPPYMIPSQFIRVAQLPLSASGKVDFSRLPEPNAPVRGTRAADARTAEVLQRMREAAGSPDMGADDDYFACGGDSLGAMRLLSELELRFGVRLRVSDLYAARTAAALSELLGAPDGAASSGCPIPAAPAREEYPLSPTQQNLYMQSMLDARGVANMPGALRVHGSLDLPRLEDAYRRLIALDPLLRAAFVRTGGRIVQTVADTAEFSVETVEGATLREAFDAFVRPFDLSRPPLIRAGIWNDPDGSQVLLCDSHHIIGDGLSSALLLQRLTQLYAGQQPAMPPVSYIDYACWLGQGGETPSESSLAYWKDTLRGVPDLLDLPCDKPRPRQFDYLGGTVSFALDARRSELCRSACRNLSLTPFALFAGAFGLLLHALSGQADFAVGTPVSGRRTPGTQDIAGPFIRSLPLRFSIRPDQTAAQYLKDVQLHIAGLLDHQDAALEQILSITGAARRADRGTLYSTLISMRPAERGPVTLGEAELRPADMPSGSAKMDLSLEVFEENGAFGFSLEYAASLFEPDSAQLMGRSLVQLCSQLAGQPDTPVGELSAWHPADRFRLLEEPLLRCAPFSDVSLDRLFAMRALASPDAPAVLWHGESLSFGALNERSDAVAAQLLSLGLARNAAVGVAVRRTPDLFAALLGILKAGFAYVPLSDTLPAQRIAAMVRAADVSVVLCPPEGENPPELPAGCRAVPLRTAGGAGFCPPQDRKSSDLFNILFTSGSTGAPKGVMLQHRAVSNLFASLSALLGPADGPVLCSTSILFDTFVTETLVPLAMGRTVALADEEEMLPPHRLAALMENTRPAVMQLTPSRLQMCLGFPAFCQAAGQLRLMILAGEALPSELVLRLRRTGCARVVNLYGPTEATVYATGADVSDGNVTIGTPLFNCRALVCDEQLRPVPPLARGELLLGGECLALGYAGDPDLTQRFFLPDPEHPGARLYRTGDIVRLRADGRLDFIGRRDRQIKLNGQRVEPGEVTGALLRQPGVCEAEVLARTLADGSQALHAFVVPAPGAQPDVQALQKALSLELPSYMVPRHISLLAAMPRTPTGKADLQALTQRAPEPADASRPQTPRDSIGQLWQKALGRSDVSPVQTFFEQGGTSLGALSLLSQYYDLGFSMTLAQFYEHPTLHAQRALLGLSDTPEQSAPAPQAETPRTDGRCAAPEEVFLTGATGFLGAHLVRALLDAGCPAVHCLVRSGEQALWDTLAHYFGTPWLDTARSRIRAVAGDLTKPDLGLSADVREELCSRISHIIHAAADVRHYAADSLPEEINVRGTARIIALARDSGAFLAHVSTISISGESMEDGSAADREFCEDDFDIGQNWRENVYVRTKYLAEQQVRAALHNGLPGCIFRIGRLVGRASDGMFQKNPGSNSFYAICRGISLMHCMPHVLAQAPVEMTPVDLCARALVLLLSQGGGTFHLFCPHTLSLRELAVFLCGSVQEVSEADFERELASAASREPALTAPLLSAYQHLRGVSSRIVPVCRCTVQTLQSLGFCWPQPDPSVLLSAFASPRTLPEK